MAASFETDVGMDADYDDDDGSTKALDLMYSGLDPITHVFQRLFITDIQNLELTEPPDNNEHGGQPRFSLLHHYNNHLVTKVDLIGLVMMVDSRRRKWSCTVDDGTGVIVCNKWTSSNMNAHHYSLSSSLLSSLPQSLTLSVKQRQILASSHCVNSVTNRHEKPEPCCALGDIVRIRGSVSSYAGHREIDILSLQKLDSPAHEINRILELPKLYSTFYDKQVNLPAKIKQSDGKCFHDELKDVIRFCIEKEELQTDSFNSSDVFQWPSVVKLLGARSESNVKTVVIEEILDGISETSGLICQTKGSSWSLKQYEIIKPGCRLGHVLLDIIQTACQRETNRVKGSHFLHIVEKLRCGSDYISVPDSVVETVLTQLECDSEIVCLGPRRYLSVNY